MGNFKQALKEVFTGENESGDVKKNVKAVKDVKKESSSNGTIDNKQDIKKEIKTVGSSKTSITNKNSNSLEKNIITKGTRILGTISTDCDIEIAGTVEGDVEANGKVIVTGNINGKITCSLADVNMAVIKGDIESREDIVIRENSTVNGNLSAKDMDISGKVNGDINASTSINIHENAFIIGNIVTPLITIEKGAILQGNLDINRDNNINDSSI